MNLKKNQIGALNPLLIVLLVVVLGVVGFAGYKVYDNTKKKDISSTQSTTQLTGAEQKAVDTECEKQYNDKDYCKFASNWASISKVTKTVYTNKDSAGKTTVMTMEADGENTSSVISEDGKETSAYISLNGNTYYKDYSANVWYKIPKAEASTDTSVPDETSPAEFDFSGGEDTSAEDKSTVKSLGKEACGNQTCFKYQIIDPSDKSTKESYIWFDDKDYKLVRWMTVSTDGSSSDGVFTYPSSVKITEPSPVQEMPSIDPSTLGQ